MEASSFALAVKLQAVCSAVAQHISPVSLSVVQAWLPAAPTSEGEWSLYATPLCCVLNDTHLQQFRLKSCHYPVAFRQSMTGRVWKTGAVQVVQNLRLVPPTMHPRVYLTEADLDRLGEALYIPVYDHSRPGMGPITVLEALLPAHCAILPADLLSFLCDSLTALKLSVSNPQPQPIKRSALTGRRARPPPDSTPELEAKQAQEHAGEANQTAVSHGSSVSAAMANKFTEQQQQQTERQADGGHANATTHLADSNSSSPVAVPQREVASNADVAGQHRPRPAAGPACLSTIQPLPVAPCASLVACWGLPQPHWGVGHSGFGSILSASTVHQQPVPQMTVAPTSACSQDCSTLATGLLQPRTRPQCSTCTMLQTGVAASPSSTPLTDAHAPESAAATVDGTNEQLPRKMRKLSGSGLVRSKSMYRVDQAHAAVKPAVSQPMKRTPTPNPLRPIGMVAAATLPAS